MEVAIDAFDFDEWVTLSKSEPDTFERRRYECVEHLISGSTNIQRMRGLQCRIDLERIRAKTSMKACLRISELMWDSLLHCHELLDTFVYRSPTEVRTLLRPTRQAKVIHLHPKS